MVARLSGIQKDVLSLYRRVLREAVNKDRDSLMASEASPPRPSFLFLKSKSESSSSTAYAAGEFRRQAATAKRSDFKKIEYMIRKGDKQIKLLKMKGVKVVGGTA